MRSRKGCWTCAGKPKQRSRNSESISDHDPLARKVQCDGGLPTCQRCSRARKDCDGYEPRLSWPKAGDERRAITSKDTPPAGMRLGQQRERYDNTTIFINTTCQDLEVYRYSSDQIPSECQPITLSPLRRQPQRHIDHLNLLQYFHNVAHRSLVTFGQPCSQIRDVLLSLALADDKAPGLALFQALLFFSSLHRYGLNDHAVQLKVQALRTMSASVAQEHACPEIAAQHVAVSMLLGSSEILYSSEGSIEWLWHTQGAMNIIQAASLMKQPHVGQVGHLLNWVHYHDTVSRFTMHHWHRNHSTYRAKGKNALRFHNERRPLLPGYRPRLPSLSPTHAIMNLLSEVCDTLAVPQRPKSNEEGYEACLKDLKKRVANVPAASALVSSTLEEREAVEVYHIATRIYLTRASQSPWNSDFDLDTLIENTFSGLVQSCTCEHFFPLFIIACEAKRDGQRIAIIDMIERVRRDSRIRSVDAVKDMIQRIWVHQDLHKDDEILVHYADTMSTGFRSSSNIPSFA